MMLVLTYLMKELFINKNRSEYIFYHIKSGATKALKCQFLFGCADKELGYM